MARQYQLTWDYETDRPGGNLLADGGIRRLSQDEVDAVLASMQREGHGSYWVDRDGERSLVYVPEQVLDYWRAHRETLGWKPRP